MRADPCQRSRRVRQRQGDGGGGRSREHAEPDRRRNSEGQGRQSDRPAARARVRAGRPRAHAAYDAKRTPRGDAPHCCGRRSSSRSTRASSKGITTFEDAGSPFETVDALKAMADKHELRMRIWMMLRDAERAAGAEARPVPDDRRGRQLPDRARDQAADRWRARLARRVAARAVRR